MSGLRSSLTRRLVVASVCLSLGGAAWADGASTTVYGTNKYPHDVNAVQSALDDPTYGTVILSGTFDFGRHGGVQITRPNTTLTSDDTSPALVLGGGRRVDHPYVWWWWYTIEVAAPGARVLDLKFDGSYDTAILLHLTEPGDGHVEISGNSVINSWAAIVGLGGAGTPDLVTVEIRDNEISDCGYGVGTDFEFPYPLEIRENYISGVLDGIRIFPFSSTLDIVGNEINDIYVDGIWVGSWSVSGESDPEWGENPPVNIIGNTLHLASPEAAGIMIGTSIHGVSNALVKNNTLKGVGGYGGLTKQPYGHNNHFEGNNLSELTSYSPQIWLLGGRDNVFLNNTLGPVEKFSVSEWGPAFQTAATLSSTINWHLNDSWGPTPDPVNFGNTFLNNDYRGTGLPGWSDGNPDSPGCVLLLDFIQQFWADQSPYEEETTTANHIVEVGKFPTVHGEKTKVCTQVLDLSNEHPDDKVPGTNSVAGWSSCEE